MLTLCPGTCHDFTILTSVLNVSDYDILMYVMISSTCGSRPKETRSLRLSPKFETF